MELTSISTFISTYIKRTGIKPEDLDEDIILDFASEAAEKLQSDNDYEHIVTLLPVKNYNAPKPSGFKKIIETAFHSGQLKDNRLMWHDEVISWTSENFCGCEVKISIECPECHQHTDNCNCKTNSVIIKADDEWLLNNTERKYWHNPRYVGAYGLNKEGRRTSFYHPQFTLMRPTQHKFFGANYQTKSHVNGCMNLDRILLGTKPIEYRLENKNIRVNSESGTILLAYKAVCKDEDGYALVQDDVDVFNAIFWDVEAKMLYRIKHKSKDNYRYSQDAEKKAEFYMARAKEKVDAMTPQEWYALMRNYMKHIKYTNSDSQAGRMLTDKFDGAVRRRRNG